MKRFYSLRVLVADDHPGLIPYTWHVPADSRDEAISLVRKRTRLRGKVVKHIDYARLAVAQVP